MKTKDEKLNRLLPEIETRIKEFFGEKVLKIILFGSFARGDFNFESDVDIIVIVSDDDLYTYRKKRVKIISEFMQKYEILLSIRIVNVNLFDKYKDYSPFYQNVFNEGIILYG